MKRLSTSTRTEYNPMLSTEIACYREQDKVLLTETFFLYINLNLVQCIKTV